MPLTLCRECGTAVPGHSHACPKCGASMAPISCAAYRPTPARPPQEPERPAWRTAAGWLNAAGWAVIVAGCVLFALFFVRASAEAKRRAAEEAEVAREEEHRRKVIAWTRDTSATAAVPGGAGRPAPTSDPAKRLWVVNRLLEDQWVWRRGILEQHGASAHEPPRGWDTAPYRANARAYPQVAKYLEGHLAAMVEIERSSPAWLDAHAAVLARESGIPAREIRDMFLRDFGGVAWDERRVADARLELHRHCVRVDPRVHHAGGTRMLYERENDLRRTQELETALNNAYAQWQRARGASHARRIATQPTE